MAIGFDVSRPSRQREEVTWLSERLARYCGIPRLLGRIRSVRCVVFHDISNGDSPFTSGLGISLRPSEFEATLEFLTANYAPVSLEDLLSSPSERDLPPNAILVTFDDGYASAMTWAAPLCAERRVPAVFFLSAAFLDNRRLSPDNLVCYVANVMGMEPINAAVREVSGCRNLKFACRADVSRTFFPSISAAQRQEFLTALEHFADLRSRQLAEQAGLYVTRQQVKELASLGFEIGSHTYSHVRCRSLTHEEMDQEIRKNGTELESISGKPVRSFSLPYGSSADLTGEVAEFLEATGHRAVFLSESVANNRSSTPRCLNRVSLHTGAEGRLSFEIEVLPRLRAVRNRLFRGRRQARLSTQELH